MNNQQRNSSNIPPLITSFHGTLLPPIEGFDPNHLENFLQAIAHIASFLRLLRDPLAESHRGDGTYFRLILNALPQIERDLSLVFSSQMEQKPLLSSPSS